MSMRIVDRMKTMSTTKPGVRLRGGPLNVYLDAATKAKLALLKRAWGCTWGEVIRRLAFERAKK